jgi:hypothetical protein
VALSPGYQTLRDEHARAIAALDQHNEQDVTPDTTAGTTADRQAGVEQTVPEQSVPEPSAENSPGPSAEHTQAMEALEHYSEQKTGPDASTGTSLDQQAGVEQTVLEPSAEQGALPEPQQETGDEREPSPGWTGRGGMVHQQASANEYNAWVNGDSGARERDPEPSAEQSAADAALDQHVDGAEQKPPELENQLDMNLDL